MQYRTLGKTGYSVSTISFGAWAIGGSWGKVDDTTSMDALRAFVEAGGNFIDTADVYGDGRSEKLVAQLKKEFPGKLIVATKTGRRLNPHTVEAYNLANIEGFIDRSLSNLQTDCLDLVQLHCPPTGIYNRPDFFEDLASLTRKGKVRHWGISVEKVEEALKGIEYDVVTTVQIIFNAFRHRPNELFFEQAKKRKIGILARVPLASGLLSGKMRPETQFARDDHRHYNKLGEVFDAGETFSGLGAHLDDAFAAVHELQALVPPGQTLAQFALRWILTHREVTCAIPGAKTAEQSHANCAASDLGPLSPEQMIEVRKIYNNLIMRHVHHYW